MLYLHFVGHLQKIIDSNVHSYACYLHNPALIASFHSSVVIENEIPIKECDQKIT